MLHWCEPLFAALRAPLQARHKVLPQDMFDSESHSAVISCKLDKTAIIEVAVTYSDVPSLRYVIIGCTTQRQTLLNVTP